MYFVCQLAAGISGEDSPRFLKKSGMIEELLHLPTGCMSSVISPRFLEKYNVCQLALIRFSYVCVFVVRYSLLLIIMIIIISIIISSIVLTSLFIANWPPSS